MRLYTTFSRIWRYPKFLYRIYYYILDIYRIYEVDTWELSTYQRSIFVYTSYVPLYISYMSHTSSSSQATVFSTQYANILVMQIYIWYRHSYSPLITTKAQLITIAYMYSIRYKLYIKLTKYTSNYQLLNSILHKELHFQYLHSILSTKDHI